MAIARRSPHRNGTEGGGPPPTRKPIGRWTWLGAALGLALLAFASVLLLGEGLADRTADRPRAGGDYQGYVTCEGAGCHDAQVQGWNATRHASAWDELQNSGSAQDYCEACHTTGAGDEARGGFNVTTDLPVVLRNVQCEVCHGPDPMSAPGGASTRIDLSSAVCGRCHQGEHHPYYPEWQNSTHSLSLLAAGGRVATDTSCQGCHVAQVAIAETFDGGSLPRPLTDPQPITCAVCHDTHSNANEFQLRRPLAELCATCHNPAGAKPGEFLEHPQAAMRNGTSAIQTADVPSTRHMNSTLCADCHMYSRPYDPGQVPPRITGHEFRPRPEACASCHDGLNATPALTVAQARAQIDTWQDATRQRLIQAGPSITAAQRALRDAPGLGFSPAAIEAATDLFDLANYSMVFVDSDGSQGVHNPTYSAALLQYAEGKAQEVIDLLRPGQVTGRVVDSSGRPVAGAEIRLEGVVRATTATDGSFTLDRAPGTYRLEVSRDGALALTKADVTVTAGRATVLGDLVLPGEGGVPLVWILLLLLAVIGIAFVWLFLRRSAKSGATETPEGEGDKQ